jgi:Glycosyl transferase family 90
MIEFFLRKFGRVKFYACGTVREFIPHPLYERGLRRLYRRIAADGLPDTIVDRINYYNKLTGAVRLRDAVQARQVQERYSYYYYDLKQYLNYFRPDLLLHYRFGDCDEYLDRPCVVKSRPIAGDNANSVLLKLDKFRHFRPWPDSQDFQDKFNAAVWRGGPHHPLRKTLLRRYNAHPRHDIGHVAAEFEGIKPKPWMTPREQMRYRYVISIEGYDVATNLKWILNSQSLCLMPRPRIETWCMEGRLNAGEDYVELRDDLADLDDKIEYYERHRDEARAIVANANRHMGQFSDEAREDLISILVLQKYFERSGQLPPEAFSARAFH